MRLSAPRAVMIPLMIVLLFLFFFSSFLLSFFLAGMINLISKWAIQFWMNDINKCSAWNSIHLALGLWIDVLCLHLHNSINTTFCKHFRFNKWRHFTLDFDCRLDSSELCLPSTSVKVVAWVTLYLEEVQWVHNRWRSPRSPDKNHPITMVRDGDSWRKPLRIWEVKIVENFWSQPRSFLLEILHDIISRNLFSNDSSTMTEILTRTFSWKIMRWNFVENFDEKIPSKIGFWLNHKCGRSKERMKALFRVNKPNEPTRDNRARGGVNVYIETQRKMVAVKPFASNNQSVDQRNDVNHPKDGKSIINFVEEIIRNSIIHRGRFGWTSDRHTTATCCFLIRMGCVGVRWALIWR